MKLLLDTHVLLWALLEPQKLSTELHTALEDSNNTLVFSAASAWELATKWRLGKLQHARSAARRQLRHGPAPSGGGRSANQHSLQPTLPKRGGVGAQSAAMGLGADHNFD